MRGATGARNVAGRDVDTGINRLLITDVLYNFFRKGLYKKTLSTCKKACRESSCINKTCR